MFNFDCITNEKNIELNSKWPYIPYNSLPHVVFVSGKTNVILNLIRKQDSDVIDKIYLYAKDLNEPKYQFLIQKHEDAGIKYLNDPKPFTEYLNTVDDVYNNIEKI